MIKNKDEGQRDVEITEFQDLLLKLIFEDTPPFPPLNRRQHKLITTCWNKYKSQNQYFLTEIFKPDESYNKYLIDRGKPKIINHKSPYSVSKDFTIKIDEQFKLDGSDINNSK
tara:strand:+ start:869 stop:1207 length:339 start_codon:yes stop_codon:yes gene_type:complete